MILSVAPCYDCCKALSASGLCNAFDWETWETFFFSAVQLQPVSSCSVPGKVFQPEEDTGYDRLTSDFK